VDEVLHVEPQPASVGVARRFARAAAAERGADEGAQDTAAMLVSELVTNVVLHARTPALVRVSTSGECLRVEVSDGSPLQPRLRRYGIGESTGRGMRLVAALALDHGTRPEPISPGSGKTVWFTLPKTGASEDGEATVHALFDLEGDL
jgi:hypothetical protein